MSIGDICVRDVDLAEPGETAWQAAVRMRQRAVGTLVIVNEARKPIGIVTDRDLTERVIADSRDPNETLMQDVMTRDPVTIGEDDSVQRAVDLMREGEIRRLPVVSEDGTLVGLLSLDDLLMRLAEQMSKIGQLVRRETPRAVAEEQLSSRWDQV